MIVDSSVLVALVRGEPEAPVLADALVEYSRRRVSAANYLEAAIVVDGAKDPVISRRFDGFIAQYEIEVTPVTVEQAKLAREAYRDFGKGSGHPAQLNFGDCFAYALAKVTGEPLLFKGKDFSYTDIESAL